MKPEYLRTVDKILENPHLPKGKFDATQKGSVIHVWMHTGNRLEKRRDFIQYCKANLKKEPREEIKFYLGMPHSMWEDQTKGARS